MPTTQYILTSDSNNTSNLMHLLSESDQAVLRSITPDDVEFVFGLGELVNIPSKGYTDPEWYWQTSDGCILGIGWRWGQTRLRGRNPVTAESASEFVSFLRREVM